MTQDDIGLMEWAFKGLVGVLFTMGGWLWVMLIGKVKEQEKSINATDKALSAHQLHVSENYAKKEDLRPIYDCLTSIQNDVKTLLSRHT